MRGIRLGRILGIPIALDLSWFFSFFLVLFVLGNDVYPEVLPRESEFVYWTLAGVTGLIFFACIILHELGHSVVARYYDIPVKSITLFILGGVAQITRDARRPLQELLMALAGPFVSILLGGIFMVLWLVTGRSSNAASTMCEWLWITNIFLGIFNLAPAFPMDGGRVLRASLWGITHNFVRATRIAVTVGRGLAGLLMAYGLLSVLLDGSDFPGVSIVSGIWLTLIGFFLWQNATASLRQAQQTQELQKFRVEDVMVRDIPAVLASTTVREMLGGPLSGYGQGRDWLFVSGGQSFEGVTPRAAVLRVPEQEWDTRVAADLMIPAARLHAIAPDATLADVLQQLQEHDVQVFPVVADGQVVGLVHEGHLGRALRTTEKAA